nr:hypothetical protein GCM10020093_082660 [Planobispora longispora]
MRRLSADALRDTRAVVQGYRRTTVEEEISNAVKVLTAADITTRMELDPGAAARPLPQTGRHLMGLVVREATTNVLRHSRARHAEADYRVTAGMVRLRVSNDGAVPPREGTGTGLRSLAERLEGGGTLTWKRDGDRFELVASLPVDTAEGGAG